MQWTSDDWAYPPPDVQAAPGHRGGWGGGGALLERRGEEGRGSRGGGGGAPGLNHIDQKLQKCTTLTHSAYAFVITSEHR